MKSSVKKGIGFGLTSGIITTLGLIMGLHSSTHSSGVVLSGILVIALADALSDAMGIHISEESESIHTTREVWEATVVTFLSKFFFSAMFIIPFLLFSLNTAIVFSVVWGLLLIVVFSFYMAKQQKANPVTVVSEHLLITVLVIVATHYIGCWASNIGQ